MVVFDLKQRWSAFSFSLISTQLTLITKWLRAYFWYPSPKLPNQPKKAYQPFTVGSPPANNPGIPPLPQPKAMQNLAFQENILIRGGCLSHQSPS
jgi:hypothetical protein